MKSKRRYLVFLWNFGKYFPLIHEEQMGKIKNNLKKANEIMALNEKMLMENK